MSADFLERYDALDAALVKAGFPPTSPWWRAEIERFARSDCRRWVVRAGRRGGKSSTLCRLAVAWALWGGWSVPPGDTAIIPFVSVDRGEASARIKTIGGILRAIGVAFDPRAEEIELTDRRLVFRVTTCSVRSVGFTAVLIVADEQARWESRDTSANPAKEVMASLRPAMATQEKAFEVCSSSPWGTDDYHAELFDLGNTDHQIVSFAETWIANPTITEERTHELEPDERAWSREYAAIPGGTASAAFDPALLQRAASAEHIPWGGLFCAIDMARPGPDGRTRRDHHAMAIGQVSEQSLTILEAVQYDHGDLTVDVVKDIATRCKKHRIAEVWSDGYESQPIEFGKHGISVHMRPYSVALKANAVDMFNRLLRENRVSMSFPEAIDQLTSIQERLAPSGQRHYRTGGLDLACACVFTPLVVVTHDPAKYPTAMHNYQAALAGLRRNRSSWETQQLFPDSPWTWKRG